MPSANPNVSPGEGGLPVLPPQREFHHIAWEKNFFPPTATPPYHLNMSQMTLPPEYLSEGPSQVDLHQPVNEKRPADGHRHSHDTDDFDINGSDEDSSRPQSRQVVEGDTLVGPKMDMPHVRYPDELGNKLPHRQNNHTYAAEQPEGPEEARTFSGGGQSFLKTDDEAFYGDEKCDWRDEDDLVDEHAKFEEKIGVKQAKK